MTTQQVRQRPSLDVVHSTHATLSGLLTAGLLDRYARLLGAYREAFEVRVFSWDSDDYSERLGVTHVPFMVRVGHSVIERGAYYLWVAMRASTMRGVVKAYGSSIPTLPLVRLLSGRPLLVTFQWDYASQTRANEAPGLKNCVAPLVERLSLMPADAVLVTTEWLEDVVRQRYDKPTVLVPNFVDAPALPGGRAGEGRQAGSVLFAGRLHHSKGLEPLIRAFQVVKQLHSRATLTICGSGEDGARLKALVASLDVRDVRFLGTLPNAEVLTLMARSQVLVLPTVTMEGHPKALIEGMACGATCVVTDVPGNREIITSGQTGLVVRPDDVDSLAEAIGRALSDEELRLTLARNAIAAAKAYSFERTVGTEIQALLALGAGQSWHGRFAPHRAQSHGRGHHAE